MSVTKVIVVNGRPKGDCFSDITSLQNEAVKDLEELFSNVPLEVYSARQMNGSQFLTLLSQLTEGEIVIYNGHGFLVDADGNDILANVPADLDEPTLRLRQRTERSMDDIRNAVKRGKGVLFLDCCYSVFGTANPESTRNQIAMMLMCNAHSTSNVSVEIDQLLKAIDEGKDDEATKQYAFYIGNILRTLDFNRIGQFFGGVVPLSVGPIDGMNVVVEAVKHALGKESQAEAPVIPQ